MGIWEEYGIVYSGVIKDVVCYLAGTGGFTHASVEAVKRYGGTATAVEVTQYRAAIGDHVHDGKIWRVMGDEEVELEAVPTPEEELADLNNAVDDLVVSVLGG